MIFETPKCPYCGELAKGTIETLKGVARLSQQMDASFEYSGDTDIWWDEQKTVTDKKGRYLMICDFGHDWYSVVSFPNTTLTTKVS